MNRLFALPLVLLVGCSPKKDANTPTEALPVVVTVAPVKSQSIRRTVSAVGMLNGYEEVILAPTSATWSPPARRCSNSNRSTTNSPSSRRSRR